MAFFGASAALVMFLLPTLMGILLGVRFVVSLAPGALLLPLRRRLFQITEPWLSPWEGWGVSTSGGADWTALVTASVCLFLARTLAPWALWVGVGLAAG